MPRFTAGSAAQRSAFGTSRCPRRWGPLPASVSPRSTSARCPESATTCPTSSMSARSRRCAHDVAASGLRVRSINGDIGDLNATLTDGPSAGRRRPPRHARRARRRHRSPRTGTALRGHRPHTARDRWRPTSTGSPPNSLGRPQCRLARRRTVDRVAALHRLCWNLERAQLLTDRLARRSTSGSSWTSATSSPPAATRSSS